MSITEQYIPTYTFAPEDDLGHIPVRHALIEVRNDYDSSEAHRHNYYEVFFFIKGGGKHLIDFVDYEVEDNSVHLVRPGQVHLLKRGPDSYGAVIHFSKEILSDIQASYHLLQEVQMPFATHATTDFKTIQLLLQLLTAELNQAHLQIPTMVTCLNLLLLKSIVKSNQPTIPQPKEVELFNAFRHLVEQHFRSGNQPLWYASQLFITEKKLNNTCKTATGNTVSNYIKERLLLEAKRLLSHSPGTIKEIGYYLGFEDPAYFNRFFGKNAGMTAGEFRAKYK